MNNMYLFIYYIIIITYAKNVFSLYVPKYFKTS